MTLLHVAGDPLENARSAIEAEERERESDHRESARRLWRALVLSPSLEVFDALLRGECVPVDRLDCDWVARLGRRGQ
jgi:hypothetical protein